MSGRLRHTRLVATAFCLVACLATVTWAAWTSGSQPALSTTADISQFDPGNIISDTMFFDGEAMTPAAISAFINNKGATCVAGSDGTPCLKNFRQDTPTRAADGICKRTYQGAAGEWAAQIIYKVGQACGISSRVLIVLLQKEQGLLTDSGSKLYASRYRSAAGMGCPDTAACDTQYYGFFNQVYGAARQYQRYATFPNNYSYVAGQNNTIQWSPNAACGSSTVYIRNQATAGLYNYTPYRPNAAALAAGYGSGDGCSAYGNRNFWLYYTDWFGSTQSPGGDAVLAAYADRGGASGALGASTNWVRCGLVFGGCVQDFVNGAIYWSPASGAYAITNGPIADAWGALRWEQSAVGYPTSDQHCGLSGGGCVQDFQAGDIYWTSATGAHVVAGAIGATWGAQGWEQSAVGYPVEDQRCGLVNSGCVQNFQNGTYYTSAASGTHAISGAIADAWGAQGWEQGPLGYPSADLLCGLVNGGCVQNFQHGSYYTSAASGTHVVTGAFATAWGAQKWEQGPLGYPTADQQCGLTGGGCKQTFQGGTLYARSATAGPFAVTGDIGTTWTTAGADAAPLGYPVENQRCGLVDGGCVQNFQKGTYYTTPATGTHAISGAIASYWGAQGWERGPLGYPTADQQCGLTSGGCKQTFQGGTLYTLPATGTHTVPGDIGTAWTAAGADAAPLGYPVDDQRCGLVGGGCVQNFQKGTYYTTPATGTHAISGAIAAFWGAQGWERGPLGYPTADQQCGLTSGGCKQTFQGGTLYTLAATGTHTVPGDIGTAWTAAGADAAPLGYPVDDQRCGLVGGGCVQNFQKGTYYTTPATGTHAISGAIASYWGARGWERGPLGYPTSDAYTVTNGTAQNFQGGRLVLDSSTGKVTAG